MLWSFVPLMLFKITLFNSCDGDNNLCKCGFLTHLLLIIISKVEENLNIYSIEFRILPYINELVKADLQNQPFTFHFNETTTKTCQKII